VDLGNALERLGTLLYATGDTEEERRDAHLLIAQLFRRWHINQASEQTGEDALAEAYDDQVAVQLVAQSAKLSATGKVAEARRAAPAVRPRRLSPGQPAGQRPAGPRRAVPAPRPEGGPQPHNQS